VFQHVQPERDVTDHYAVMLQWPDGFQGSLVHSWVGPADDAFTGTSLRILGTRGGLDFGTGVVTYRDKGRQRDVLHPGPQPDTRRALEAFFDAVRSDEPLAPPVTLAEARDATVIGLLIRQAVDSGGPAETSDVTPLA
jgi:predicted dehydrogenase